MSFEIGTIAIGSDHRARDIVDELAAHLESIGWVVHVHYGSEEDSVDYPIPAMAVTEEVMNDVATCGVLVCGSGIGMSMAANKTQGIRAALVHEPRAAEMSRRHNNANVLCLAADSPIDTNYTDILDVWLGTDFDGGRHQRRIDMMQ
ncbi:MAG TPA: RpiB/LacA/LacB family sugar-phosphate isomerase [Phycisphaerales bacterium]|nr:RpiB/LacA/LacB family sugar-phosphate isomerase [Phycisphaerales bacterium]